MAFVLIGLLGTRLKNGGGLWAVVAEGLALVWGLYVALSEMGAPLPYHDVSFVWFGLPNGTNFAMGTLVSPLGALMLLVVNGVGLLVVVYSLEYMGHEEGLPRYYAELMLFLTAMNALVLADNYLEFVLFWELVGVCSYLLIGFFWKKPEAAAAAKKAFLVTRVGDVMFFIGIFVFFTAFAGVVDPHAVLYPGTSCPGASVGGGLPWACAGFTFTTPNANSATTFLPAGIVAQNANPWLMGFGGVMILGGAVGKSAQFPLHPWLPDAMEGPTTVSALIHAATMVAAGIYLLAITAIFLGFTEITSLIILAIGGFTSFFAGTMGLVAPDIKRVIAYSTISQLGYMAMAVGASSLVSDVSGTFVGPGAAMFHLFTHAFFKALLFLAAGSVIHVVGTQDLFKMGGLRKYMPVTATTMLVGALALSGIPPFSGFFSKDDLLGLTYAAAQADAVAWPFFALALLAVFLTALYIFRLVFLAFSGDRYRGAPPSAPHPGAAGTHPPTDPHEPSWIMRGPLVILAALSVAAGFLPLLPAFRGLLPGLSWGLFGFTYTGSGWIFSTPDLVISAISLGLALLGLTTAWRLWGNGRVYALPAAGPLPRIHGVLLHRYYIDDAYDAFGRSVILGIARGFAWIDRYVIDGTIHGFEEVFSGISTRGRKLQTGLVSNYASWVILGLVVLVAFFLFVVPHLSGILGGG